MNKMTARQKVQAYLQKQHSASAPQIARALGMKAPDIRHHLSILAADGRIVMLGEMPNKGRGRPVKVYGLSGRALGDNLALLAGSLMDELVMKPSQAKRQAALQSLAKRLSDQIGRIEADKSGGKRLSNLVEKLNSYHYQARWEAGAEGPRLLFARCPYAAIIERQPELCHMDEYMLGELMGGKAQQLAKIDQKPGGNIHCIIKIQ
jgi:predicted ArsR family transcriptional regulator